MNYFKLIIIILFIAFLYFLINFYFITNFDSAINIISTLNSLTPLITIVIFSLIFTNFIIIFFESAEREAITTKENKPLLFDDEVIVNEDNKNVQAIKNLIETYKSEHFFSIGLIGGWGVGKSTIIESLISIFKTKNIETIYINVWKLEQSKNILNELRISFDNIIFNKTPFWWIFYKLENILVKPYFNNLLNYTNIGINNNILDKTLQNKKEQFNKQLQRALNNKVLIFFDEIDRLTDKEEIMEVFKIIRYLASFDNVISISATDLNAINEHLDKVELNYVHKIFNTKYHIRGIEQNDLLLYFKDNVLPRLNTFREDIGTSIYNYARDSYVEDIKCSLFNVLSTYREIKSAHNDTIFLLSSLDSQWQEYIDVEFIFMLNMLKAVSFNDYQKLVEDKKFIEAMDILAEPTSPENRFLKKDKVTFSDVYKNLTVMYSKNTANILVFIYNYLIMNKKMHLVSQFFDVFLSYRIYEYFLSNEKIEKYVESIENIDEDFKNLYSNEYKYQYLNNLVEVTTRLNEVNKILILEKIITILASNKKDIHSIEYLVKALTSARYMEFFCNLSDFNILKPIFEDNELTLLFIENIIASINNISNLREADTTNIKENFIKCLNSQDTVTKEKIDLKYIMTFSKLLSYSSDENVRICLIDNLIARVDIKDKKLINSTIYYLLDKIRGEEAINEYFNKTKLSEFVKYIEDTNQYQIFSGIKHGSSFSSIDIMGKELKEIISSTK